MDLIFELPAAGIFALVLAIVALVALLLQAVFRSAPVQRAAPELSNVSLAVATVVGALFGLSVTFLANSVWTTEDKARESVSAEARAIRVMEVYLDATQEPPHNNLYQLLADYGRGVAEEWGNMADYGGGDAAEHSLRKIYQTVLSDVSHSDQDRLLQQRLLVALDSLSTARQVRLSIAQDVVSLPQWVLVIGLGLVLMLVVATIHVEHPGARRLALSAVVLAISIMLFVIVLHDRPFVGESALKPDAILHAAGVQE